MQLINDEMQNFINGKEGIIISKLLNKLNSKLYYRKPPLSKRRFFSKQKKIMTGSTDFFALFQLQL